MCEVVQNFVNKGIEQGVDRGMKTAALRMLKAGKYALEKIAEISGLPLDEIKELRANPGV